MHDRESFYRYLWSKTDRSGKLKLSQQEISDDSGIPYQRVSQIITEFIELKRIRKFKHKFYLFNPDTLDWTDDFKKDAKKLRKEKAS